MALETERCSPSNASSPGPNGNRRPGSEGGSSSGYQQNSPRGAEDSSQDPKSGKPKSAFHQIALLTRCSSPTSFDSEPEPSERVFSRTSDDSRPMLFDRPSFQTRMMPDVKPPSRPLSNESSSSHSIRHSSGDKPFSDSSPPSSPPGPHSPEYRNGFVDARLYHPDMASLSLVYGLGVGVGVIPNRFPLSLQLPAVYPEVDRTFAAIPRVPTVLPVKPADTLGLFVNRHVVDGQHLLDPRVSMSVKPPVLPVKSHGVPAAGSSCAAGAAALGKAQGPRCDCCRSPSPRSPSPRERQPPGPSSLTFSVDNILRPDFGRCQKSAEHQQIRRSKAVKGSLLKTPSTTGEADSGLVVPKLSGHSDKNDTNSSEEKDSNGQSWPAWVYCTRYSDRPSSGEHHSYT